MGQRIAKSDRRFAHCGHLYLRPLPGPVQASRHTRGTVRSPIRLLIVDNSSTGDIARSWDGIDGLDAQCCHEPAPGLSRASNRALSQVRSDYVAWIDDDEIADRDWVAWLKRGFATPGRPDAVAGVMLPAELETNAQVNFERYGGFNKGRGMEPIRLSGRTSPGGGPALPAAGLRSGREHGIPNPGVTGDRWLRQSPRCRHMDAGLVAVTGTGLLDPSPAASSDVALPPPNR
jgi:Glycosyl transferase family 2